MIEHQPRKLELTSSIEVVQNEGPGERESLGAMI